MGKVFIPDLKKGNTGINLSPFKGTTTSDYNRRQFKYDFKNPDVDSQYDYIDPGYDDPASEEEVDEDFSFDSWEGDSAPEYEGASEYEAARFKYLEEVVKNSPEFEKIKNDRKLNEAQKQQKLLELNQAKAKEYDEFEKKGDLNGFLNQYQSMVDNLPENNNKSYDPKTQKTGELPIMEVATSLFGILNGNKMADTDLPERNEQVSETFRNFTAEIKKLSEIGLKPEEEAYAKNMLAESYQANLDMIQRASNGNRNILLGNLGRLDYQKQKGLMDLAVADSKAKTDALYKYGEAVKYISEFESQKDIANNERAYNNAMLTKEAGGRLASQGWASLMDNIQNYKENKPGSANAMLRTHYMRKMYDVDYNETDPTNYYHPDNHKKRQEAYETYRQNVTTINDTLKGLSEEDQKLYQQYEKKTGVGNKDNVRFIEFLANTKGQDRGDMNLTKINDASIANNYGVLFDNENTVVPFSSETNSVDAGTNVPEEVYQNKSAGYLSSHQIVAPEITDKMPGIYKPSVPAIPSSLPTAPEPSKTQPPAYLATGSTQNSTPSPTEGSGMLFERFRNQANENERIAKNAYSFLSEQELRIKAIAEETQRINQESQLINR